MLGGEPDGEVAAEVFDQYTAEAFHRAEGGAVDHDGRVFFVVGSDVAEAEADGENVVYLNGAELPFAADDVFDHEVDFRAVEGGFARFFGEGDAEGLGGVAAGGFGDIPLLGVAGEFFAVGVAEADAHAVVGHAEGREDGFDEGEAALDFLRDLVGRAEEVGIILSEAADAGHAVEFAGLFPAVNGAEFGESDGQVAVAVGLRVEDLDVVRAVHGLEHEAVEETVCVHDAVGRDHFFADALVELVGELLGNGFEAGGEFGAAAAFVGEFREGVGFGEGRELGVFVVGEMARRFVEGEFADVRGEDLGVALFAELFADEVLEFLADDRTVGRPEDETLANVFVDVEKFQVAAKFAVVADG